MHPAVLITSVIAAVLFCLCGISSCNIVDPGNRGVAIQQGKVKSEPIPEGVYWATPFLEDVKSINVQQGTYQGSTQCFSSDLQTVTISYSIMQRNNPVNVVTLYTEFKGDPFETLTRPRFEELLKQATSAFTAEQIVQNREKIKLQTKEGLIKVAGNMVLIDDVVINNVDLSDQLEAAIEAKQVEQQRSLAKKYELEKEQKEAEITIVKAKAEAESLNITGNALKQNPEIVTLEIAKKWDGKSPTSVVVGTGGANVLLPLK